MKNSLMKRAARKTGILRRLGSSAVVMLALGLAAPAALPIPGGSASAQAVACDRWASPSGDNANSGSEASPYRSVAHLVSQLAAGQTGCLVAATFNEPPGTFIVSSTQGTPASPVTITSADPTDPARINGQLWLKEDADHVVFRNLHFTGSPGTDKSVMLLVGGADGIVFLDNEITFARGICLNIGVLAERSEGFRLEGNRIHDCGIDVTLTGADSGVHGVYLVNTQGAVIHDNWIYDNKNRGIQHYPNADGSLITNNLLDGNGSNLNLSSEFSEGYLSEGILVRDNLITNSDLLALGNPNWPDADSAQVWGYGFGGTARQPNQGDTHGNLVTENCIYQPNPNHNFGGWGYAQTANTFADPQYADRANKDFTLLPTSPCKGKGPKLRFPKSPPDTRLLKHPGAKTRLKSATFRFASPTPESTFECRLDSMPWRPCASPATFTNLKPGRHRFAVRALNAIGPDRTPAEWKWTIERSPTAACLSARAKSKKAKSALTKARKTLARSKRPEARVRIKSRLKRFRRALERTRIHQRKMCAPASNRK